MLLIVNFCFGVGRDHENARHLLLSTRTADIEGFTGRESGLGVFEWNARDNSDSETSRRN